MHVSFSAQVFECNLLGLHCRTFECTSILVSKDSVKVASELCWRVEVPLGLLLRDAIMCFLAKFVPLLLAICWAGVFLSCT
jgi:hypothetical protein